MRLKLLISSQLVDAMLPADIVPFNCTTLAVSASRSGSFAPAGEQTSISCYMIDFQTWEQVNIDNGRRVRLVFLHGRKAGAEWNGQIDGQ